MKTARDFMIEIPVLNCHDGITKARQIYETTVPRSLRHRDKKGPAGVYRYHGCPAGDRDEVKRDR